MALDSPVFSEPDSLIEKKPIQTGDEIVRGNTNYLTFTKKRPTNLPYKTKKSKRQSLNSPQSIQNLDSDDMMTPDFAMTQSMYEPLEKRKQQAQVEENSRLLNLLASEKAAQAAKERKLKEIRKKAIENKKRNEEKQKHAEERRLRMLADQEERNKKLLTKMNITNNVVGSCYISAPKTCNKNKVMTGSGFIDKRPLSSTGKVFGFGSSAPRDVCEKLSFCKSRDKDLCTVGIRKPEAPISRMFASQIVNKTNYEGETKIARQSKKSFPRDSVDSNVNISNFNKSLIKSQKASSITKKENVNIKVSPPKLMSPEIKSTRFQSNLNGINKVSIINHRMESTSKPRGRSVEKAKSNIVIKVEPRPRTVESRKPNSKHSKMDRVPNGNEKKSPITSVVKEKRPKKSEKFSSKDNLVQLDNKPTRIPTEEQINQQIDTNKKSEVRFKGTDHFGEDNNVLSPQSSASIERRAASTSNLTDEEYKQRLALQRKLAKEKKRLEMEKQELSRKAEIEAQDKYSEVQQENSTTQGDISENSEIHVEEIKADVPIICKVEIKKPESADKEDGSVVETSPKAPKDDDSTAMLKSEQNHISSPQPEIAASTEGLDRLERKKRLDSIMSRIKKPMGGSTENVTSQQRATTLQDMMNKGYLSGMSKTAAILMKNAHQSSELSTSSTDLNGTGEPNKKNDSAPNDSTDIEENGRSENVASPLKIEESRGACDGQEDAFSENLFHDTQNVKSNLANSLFSDSSKPYLSSWQDKYSDSLSLDNDDEKANQVS